VVGKLRHIFIFICIFSVFSLTLQASVINLCKESKVFKNQNQNNPITEEEEESHDSDEEGDNVIYLNHDRVFMTSPIETLTCWPSAERGYYSFTKSIPIPPPKF
jgi:hypothetical protein